MRESFSDQVGDLIHKFYRDSERNEWAGKVASENFKLLIRLHLLISGKIHRRKRYDGEAAWEESSDANLNFDRYYYKTISEDMDDLRESNYTSTLTWGIK